VSVKRKILAQHALSKKIWDIASDLVVYDTEAGITIRTVTDLDECQAIWRAVIPGEVITDLWEVRDCFQRHFRRPVKFLVIEDSSGVSGLLPLSFIEELRCYGYFPGETWHGKTWLEQNRIYLRTEEPQTLLSRFRLPYHLRYLCLQENLPQNELTIDEIGYLFSPPQYDFSIENYFQEFSHKSIKQILKDVAALERMGVSYRYDDLSDFDLMIRLNISRFGADSYFFDRRFRESFHSLAYFLYENGWLRLTTVLIENEPAAVDMGCLYRGVYTLMAGGTNHRYPGVAKLINLHHLQRACEERMQQVDFLCGDFNWKKLFHLTPRPLFLLSNAAAEQTRQENLQYVRSRLHA
jgi:hypothetical protein